MRYCGEMEKSYKKRRSRELDTLDILEAYRLADESGALLRRVVQLLPMPARSVDKLLRILREVETITDWRIPDCLHECASPEAWGEFQKNRSFRPTTKGARIETRKTLPAANQAERPAAAATPGVARQEPGLPPPRRST